MKRTELSDLGEFGLIERIKNEAFSTNKSTLLGIGDDAAVIEKDAEEVFLVTTDMLMEGIHFDLTYVPLKHLGYKAVAVNVSDIAAMNGTPQQLTVGLGLSNRFSLEAIDEFYQGVRLACENYKVDLVGGDTVSSRSGLVISITAVGVAKKDKVTYRNTAKEGDIVCVTGDLGAAYMGLQVLEREKAEYLSNPDMQPQLAGKDYIVERQLKPEARMDVIYELRELGILPTSMIDISDGLASEIMHLCKQSNVGAELAEENLPIDDATYETAREFDIDPLTCLLNGGEDYELLFTLNKEDMSKIKNHPDITIIGRITEKTTGVRIITKAGNAFPIKAQGWVAF
jgi:thiamine-monophosphate kinase